MNLFGGIWDAGCSWVQNGAHVIAKTIMIGPVLGGEAVKCVSKCVSVPLKAVGADRFADVIDNAGKAVADAGETLSDVVVAAADIGTGSVLAVGSFIVGEDATADKLGQNIRESLESLESNAESAVEHLSAVKDNFVGKAQFDLAHSKYVQLMTANRENVAGIRKEREKLKNKINEILKSINKQKAASVALFDRFAAVTCKIAQWSVSRYETDDVFYGEDVNVVPLRSDAEIFTDVDFRNDPIWSHIKGVFTAGLLTVSQVEDVMVKIKGYERAAEASWEQDRETNRRYKKLLESLDFVKDAFDMFVPLYTRLQDELEYAISSLSQIMAQRDMYYFADADVKINPYFLPKHHLNILIACDKLTRILCEMNKRHYVQERDNEAEFIEDDRKKVCLLKKCEFREVEKLLAA